MATRKEYRQYNYNFRDEDQPLSNPATGNTGSIRSNDTSPTPPQTARTPEKNDYVEYIEGYGWATQKNPTYQFGATPRQGGTTKDTKGQVDSGQPSTQQSYQLPLAQTTTQKTSTKYKGKAPEFPDFGPTPKPNRVEFGELPEKPEFPTERPELNLPEYDEARVRRETEKSMGVERKLLQRTLREQTAGLGRDPQSQRVLRDALQQHGINTSIMRRNIEEEKSAQEERRVARETQPALVKYQADVQFMRDKHQGDWNAYANEMTKLASQYQGDLAVENMYYQALMQEPQLQIAKFNAAWNEYASTAETVTTRTHTYGTGGSTTRSRPAEMPNVRISSIPPGGSIGWRSATV